MKTIAIMGTAGFIPDPDRYDTERRLEILGQNAGNLMFQYAATSLIAAPKIHVGKTGVSYSDFDAIAAVDVIVVPMANHFRLGADWSSFARFLERTGKPLIVLGLGAQAPQRDGEDQAIDALVADPEVRRLAERVREQAIVTTVRGDFSKRVCAALGIADVHVLGCPSLLIDRDPALGRKIAGRLAEYAGSDAPRRFGVAAAATYEIRNKPERKQVERRLFRWATRHDALYVQQSGGPNVANFWSGARSVVPEKAQEHFRRILAPQSEPAAFFDYVDRRGRLFTDARDWMAEAGALDFVVGSRLHGVMAAIGGGAPGIVISHDSRTAELERGMRLPRLSMEDIRAPGTLRQKLAKVRFDGEAFDRNRTETRRRFAGLINDALGDGAADPGGVHS